jgi:hypothetical protein
MRTAKPGLANELLHARSQARISQDGKKTGFLGTQYHPVKDSYAIKRDIYVKI